MERCGRGWVAGRTRYGCERIGSGDGDLLLSPVMAEPSICDLLLSPVLAEPSLGGLGGRASAMAKAKANEQRNARMVRFEKEEEEKSILKGGVYENVELRAGGGKMSSWNDDDNDGGENRSMSRTRKSPSPTSHPR